MRSRASLFVYPPPRTRAWANSERPQWNRPTFATHETWTQISKSWWESVNYTRVPPLRMFLIRSLPHVVRINRYGVVSFYHFRLSFLLIRIETVFLKRNWTDLNCQVCVCVCVLKLGSFRFRPTLDYYYFFLMFFWLD